MKRSLLLLATVVAALTATTSFAQTISVGSSTGPSPGATTPALTPVTFTRNAATPVADFTVRVTYNTTNFDATVAAANGGSCSANDASGFVTVLPPPGSSDVATNVYCNITFTIAAGVAAANYALTPITSFPGGGCFDTNANTVACTLTPGQITVTGGGGAVGPTITYNPAAGASAGTGGPVNFTGVTTPGTTGTGMITATPSGGSGGGTTTVGAFSFTGANAAAFTVTSAATLTFTAGVNTAQNITMTCLSTAAAQTANLQATETITGGATSTRFWVVNCPAGVAGVNTPPTITYAPAAGTTINVASGAATVIQVGCPTDGSPCNGAGSGLAATSRLETLAAVYAGPPFSPTPSMVCAFVTEAGVPTGGSTLDFVALAADAGDIRCTCPVVQAPEPFTVTVNERIPANSANPTATRTFTINCGSGLVCPTLSATPANGTISLTNGGANGLVTTYTVTGLVAPNTQAINCVTSAVTAGSTFTITTVPNPLVLTTATPSGTVSASCTNTNLTTATATLTCTPAVSTAGCTAPAPNVFTLSCPGGVAPPTVDIVPVPALGEQGRILLAAMMLLLGLAVVGFRVRN